MGDSDGSAFRWPGKRALRIECLLHRRVRHNEPQSEEVSASCERGGFRGGFAGVGRPNGYGLVWPTVMLRGTDRAEGMDLDSLSECQMSGAGESRDISRCPGVRERRQLHFKSDAHEMALHTV